VPEEEKEAQRAAAEASLDAEIEQLDKELSPNQPNLQAADGTASIEETKAGQIMNNKQGRVMTENASNIST